MSWQRRMASMSEQEQLLNEIKAAIFNLSSDEQEAVRKLTEQIERIVVDNPGYGALAFAFLGAKLQVQ